MSADRREDIVNSKLVGSMFFSVLVGGACAGATLWSGGGFLAALGAYSAGGSASLVPAALWASAEPRQRGGLARVKRGAAVA